MSQRNCPSVSFLQKDPLLYSAFTNKVERSCHFPAPGWKYMTHRQARQGFPDTNQVSLHKNNKIFLLSKQQFLPGAGKWQLRSTLSVNALYIDAQVSCSEH
jgi:hypothetical protein